MAHADYDCCMICDCKMNYNAYDSETKARPCEDCLRAMRDIGVVLLDADELTAHLTKIGHEAAHEFLTKLGYSECFYPNSVDACVKHLASSRTEDQP